MNKTTTGDRTAEYTIPSQPGKIVDYNIVSGPFEIFSYRIRTALNFGYVPYGNPFTHNGEFHQAMIKYAT